MCGAMDTTRLLFVSHSHEDDPFCLRLIADLRANLGVEAVWYDTSGGLHGGDDWWNRILAEITERPYFLVVLSPNASASKYVQEEMSIAYRLKVELGTRLRPVRLADSPRRVDWGGVQEFDFTQAGDPARYAAALTELLRSIDPKLTAPKISDPSVSPTPGVPDRPLSPTERLAQEAHAAYGHEHWSDVLDKTAILIERAAMTPTLWRERASATFALDDSVGGLAVIKQALNAGVDDADTLLVYARLIAKAATGQQARAGDDQRAVEMLSRAYALASLDDTATHLAILEEMIAVLDAFGRLGVSTWNDEYARRVRDARRMAPDDPRWALREIQVLLKEGQYDKSLAAARTLPNTRDSALTLSDWRTAIASAAMVENWPAYDALLDAAAHAGVDPGIIARWHLDFPHFVPKVTLSGYSGYMRSLAWSRDGTRLAIIGGGGSNKGIWDAASGRLLVTLSEGRGAAVKRMFAKALDDRHSATIFSSLSWSPDGTRVAAGTSEMGKLAIVWDANSGDPLITLRGDHYYDPFSGVTTTVIWSPDGARIATAGGGVRLWDASSWRPLVTLAGGEPLVWSLDGKRLATTGSDCVQVWDALSGRLLATLADGQAPMAWSPNGTRLAMRGNDRYSADGEGVGIWEVASGQRLATLFGPTEYATNVSWTPDGERLVGAMFGRPAMWDATNGEELNSVPPGGSETQKGVQSVAWAFDGQQVAVVDKPNSEHATVQIWGKE